VSGRRGNRRGSIVHGFKARRAIAGRWRKRPARRILALRDQRSTPMAIDLSEETRAVKAPAHEIGQDLSRLSVAELAERILILEREIERLKEAQSGKERTKLAADAFFRT
jgi:uncharacterized small protein (DUF1192 family)